MKSNILLVVSLGMLTSCSWYQSNIAKYNPFDDMDNEEVVVVDDKAKDKGEAKSIEKVSDIEANTVAKIEEKSKATVSDVELKGSIIDEDKEQKTLQVKQTPVVSVKNKVKKRPEKKPPAKEVVSISENKRKIMSQPNGADEVTKSKETIPSNKEATKIALVEEAKKVVPQVASSQEKSTTYPILKQSALHGSVSFSGDSEKTSVLGAIISLKSIDDKSVNSQTKTHEVDMKGKAYDPGYLTIKTGDKLLFKNLDSIKHNVFSSSGKNTFDLGTYGYNKAEQQQFNHEGIVKVYCNIHPEMALFVSVTDSNLSFVTDETGFYEFSNIKAGRYLLSVWHLRGTYSKEIVIEENKRKTQHIEINIASYKPKPHLNKFGKPYKKTPPIFKDEFY